MKKRGRKPRSLRDRLWAKVDVRGPDECWPWTGQLEDGYGLISSSTKPQKKFRAHRLAVKFTRGEEAPLYRHTCNNRACCNPAHLVAGTNAENNADTKAAGNLRVGERHHMAKLTEQDVLAIRADPRLQRVVAEEYGVSAVNICMIVNRKTWTHL